MILAYRQKTGCKQYVFDNKLQAFEYFGKKCYYKEHIKLIEYDDVSNKEVSTLNFVNNWHSSQTAPVI